MVKRLILKDLFLQRWSYAGALGAGLIALALLGAGSEGSFYGGVVLLATALITLGAYLAVTTVVDERKDQTLPFIMSFPITSRQYAMAKILGNLAGFGAVFTLLLLGAVVVIQGSSGIPNGLIPFATIAMGEIFVSTCFILAVALVTESHGWTFGAIMAGNLLFNGFLFFLSRVQSFASTSGGSEFVWHRDAILLLVAEIGGIVLLLAVAYIVSARRRDFI